MTARYDWTINQGETSTLKVTRFESDGSTKIPFTGTFAGSVKDKYGGTESLAIANSDVTIDNTGGGANTHIIDIKLSATKTAAIAAGKYIYDLENLDSSGDTTRVLEGSFIVKAEVTT